MRVTVLEVIQRTTEYFARKGIANPRREAEWILSHELGMPRLNLYLQFERVLTEAELDRLREKVRRRAQREPLAYVLGTASFCGLELKVGPAVLIPRPETEVLAQEALAWARQQQEPATSTLRILDFGTGSGCLAIFLAHELPEAQVTAVEVSAEALAIARENAQRHQVGDRIRWIQQAGLEGLESEGPFDLIVSNPPYIPTAQIEQLEPEVKDHEPRIALDGGPDGLTVIRQIAEKGLGLLTPGGRLYLEFGESQEEQIPPLFESLGWKTVGVIPDLSEKPRIYVAERPNRMETAKEK